MFQTFLNFEARKFCAEFTTPACVFLAATDNLTAIANNQWITFCLTDF